MDKMSAWMYEQPQVRIPRPTPVVKILLILNVVVFVLQFVGRHALGFVVLRTAFGREIVTRLPVVEALFGLNVLFFKSWFLWQIVTYMFLHGSLMHLLFNMLLLYFMGPETERAIGPRRFTTLYLASGIIGGLGWLALSARGIFPCIGASGAIFGILGLFAALFPYREITLWVFFVLPVTMTARMLAILLGATSLALLYFSGEGGVAHAAHLGGGIAGYLYGRFLLGGGIAGRWDSFGMGAGGRERRRGRRVIPWIGGLFRGSRRRKPTGEETDRILDKMIEGGFQSLTDAERKTLERAARD